MGHWPGLVFGFGLYDLHPNGDGHQDLAVRGTSHRGELIEFLSDTLKK